jgi:hypothetical protein
MPRKPRNPKDSAQVKGKKLQAMATMALSIKSELDALMATMPAYHEIWFRVMVVDMGKEGRIAHLCGTHFTRCGAPKPNPNPPRLTGSLIGSAVKHMPVLADELERHGIVNRIRSPRFQRIEDPEHGDRVLMYQVDLRAALELLNEALPAIATRLGLGYQLNEGIKHLVSAYIAVIAHPQHADTGIARRRKRNPLNSSKGARQVAISNWENMVQEFTKQPISQHYEQLHLLGSSSSRRKAAGALAHELGLIRIMSTRGVELLPKGLAHHKSCLAAINAGQSLPDPFG